jgi:lysophospholipid acyltransferase (LPLAT)-like uncharacterized protein
LRKCPSVEKTRRWVYLGASVAPFAQTIRQLRFWLLERLVLPFVMRLFRLLIRSWRVDGPDPDLVSRVAAEPRVMVTLWHGNLPNGMVCHRLFRPYGRRWVGLVTPSLDGRLLSQALSYLDVGSAPLRDGVRGINGAADFVQCVAAGSVGAVAADGPRGPRHVVKDGVARTAAAASARIVVAGVATARGFRLRSWDRPHVAGPFARVSVCWRLLSPAEASDTAAIQTAMDAVQEEAIRRAGAAGDA